MSKVTLSPVDLSIAEKTGRRTFRKQILKKGTINYQGTRVDFDDDFLSDCVEAFKNGAYDQVPFVLATPDNAHNMDPERYRGEIVDMELTDDGIDAIIETTKSGAKAIEDNPKLGVSARIVQGLAKVDGRSFPRAIQHVLATMDPRLTGMQPWQPVDLAMYSGDDEVLDLTAATVKKGNSVATKPKARSGGVVSFDLSSLTDEQFNILLSTAVMDPETDTDDGTEERTVTVKTKRSPKRVVGKRVVQEAAAEEDEDLDEVVDEDDDDVEYVDEEGNAVDAEGNLLEDDEDAELEDEDEDDEDEVVEAPAARVKAKPRKAVPGQRRKVELSEPVRPAKKMSKARRLELMLSERVWESEKSKYIGAGVPPFLVDLAEPVLKSPDSQLLDLSEVGGGSVDARTTIRKMLDGVKGMVDLRPEIGHQVDLSTIEKDSPTDRALQAWNETYGTP